jgi:hypothetical protein
VRILFFGSSLPNSAALIPAGAAAGTNNLYGCLSIDAATTGPGTSFTTGAPYATKFLQGDLICTNANFVAASSPRITFMESTEGICIWFSLCYDDCVVHWRQVANQERWNGSVV